MKKNLIFAFGVLLFALGVFYGLATIVPDAEKKVSLLFLLSVLAYLCFGYSIIKGRRNIRWISVFLIIIGFDLLQQAHIRLIKPL